MSDPFDQAISQSVDWAESGASMDLVIGDDGLTTYALPEPEMPIEQEQSTLPASMTRKQRRGQEPTITPMEGLERFGETMAGASVGLVPGMVAGSVGAVPDIGGLIYGGLKAAGAEEGERLQAFSEGFGNIITENVGSENLLNVFGQLVDIMPVSEDVKEGMRAGAEAGSFVGIGGAATAGGKAAVKTGRDLIEVMQSSAEQAARKDVPFPFDQLPDRTTITPDEKSLWEEQSKAFKFSQPVTTAEDAMETAQRNQQVLGGMGRTIANSTGANFKNPGIKGQNDAGKRLAEKAEQKGGVRLLTDITRGGFTVDSVQQAEDVVDMLADNYKIIDEGYTVTPLGYFDRKVLLINADGQIGEVQIWPSPAMFDAKLTKGGQDLYTIVRGAKTPDQMNAEELAEYNKVVNKYNLQGETHDEIVADATNKSLDLYAEGIKGSDPEMQQIAIDRLKEIAAGSGDDSRSAVAMLDKLGEAAQ